MNLYTSSAESLSLLRAVPRRNTRGLCSQGIHWENPTGIIPIEIDMSIFINKKILGISLLVTVSVQGHTQEFLTRGEG
jgi:hypothetical protein